MTDTLNETRGELLAGQPVRIVERDGVRYTLLGTAHVSAASVQAVEHAIGNGQFDAVAVELDPQRLQALTDPDAMARLDLVELIRKGRVALFAANLALAAYQRRLAEQLGIEPGAELKRAVQLAKENNLPVHLIDRDVGLTFRRASQQLGFFGKLKLIAGIGAGLFSSEDVGEEEIEKLKQGDMLESSLGEFPPARARRCTTPSSASATATWPRACARSTTPNNATCWRWSVPATLPVWRAIWKPTPTRPARCARNWKPCRRSATSRGSP